MWRSRRRCAGAGRRGSIGGWSASGGGCGEGVEQVGEVIVARLNGDVEEQAALCGCGTACFNRCPERMQRVVDAGASRIGLVLGETASARDWASLVDHTLLKPEASEADIERLCQGGGRVECARAGAG